MKRVAPIYNWRVWRYLGFGHPQPLFIPLVGRDIIPLIVMNDFRLNWIMRLTTLVSGRVRIVAILEWHTKTNEVVGKNMRLGVLPPGTPHNYGHEETSRLAKKHYETEFRRFRAEEAEASSARAASPWSSS